MYTVCMSLVFLCSIIVKHVIKIVMEDIFLLKKSASVDIMIVRMESVM